MLKASTNIGKTGKNTPTSVGPSGPYNPNNQARVSLDGKNPYNAPRAQGYENASPESYGPAYKNTDGDWFRPAYWHGKQPQEYLDDMEQRQKDYTDELNRKRQQSESDRLRNKQQWEGDRDYRTQADQQETDKRYGGQNAYEIPQVEDDYERMANPDYRYNNDAPNQNSNAGDLSAAYDRNTSGLLSGLLSNEGLSPDGIRGLEDFQRGLTADAKSEIEQDAQARNAQGGVGGNQLEQEGMAQQANLYGQINDRAQSQMGLAQQMQSSRLKDHTAQMNTWSANIKKRWGDSFNQGFGAADKRMKTMFETMFKDGLFSTQVSDPYGGPR